MARPKPAPSAVQLQPRPRPEHPFAPAAAEPDPALKAPAASPAAGRTAATAQGRTAATAATRNGADAASRIDEAEEPLVKFSVRMPPSKHRHLKVAAAMQGMSIQDLATVAIAEYLERLGHPLP